MLRLTIFACLLAIVVADRSRFPPFRETFRWNYIQYNWPSPTHLEQAKTDQLYIEANNAMAGIKLWRGNLYLTIPRWKSGVPVTLAVTSATPLNGVTNPKLDPYPSWDMQTPDNCSAFQFVQSMEIDPSGRMWVLDTGRTKTMTETPVTKCPPRLVILDLENNGTILLNYVFPDDVASRESVWLNDIVLDHQNGGMAFISDSGDSDPGIIVYSLKDNSSWKVRHSSMSAQDDATNFTVAHTPVTKPIGIDGIALSPPGPDRLVYYSPLSSFHLYSIPVSILKNSTLENVDSFVTDLGVKGSQADGLIMTNKGFLFYGLLDGDSVAMWNSIDHRSSLNVHRRLVARDHQLLQWPDTFAIDEDGQLWCVSNALQKFISGQVDISQPNYRIMRSLISAKNYQYFENDTSPELPTITKTVMTDVGSRRGLRWIEKFGNLMLAQVSSKSSSPIFDTRHGQNIAFVIILVNIFLRI